MPTYDYKCENCGHQFETYQSMKDEKLTKCPSCGKKTLKRLIGTGGGLIFKGSGFYLTDYKNKPSESKSSQGVTSAANKKESKPESTTSSSDNTSQTDSKVKGDSKSKQPEKSSKAKTDKE
jgi:putative FmdB family regulatory protein